jgi:hypothetical protein
MRYQRTWLWLVILLGLAIRAALCCIRTNDLTSDNDGYLAHAGPVARGEGFLGPHTHRPTAFRPPAYPVALGLLIRCGLSDSVSVAVVNILASIVILVLTWMLSLQSGLPVLIALLSVWLAALDPLLLRYSVLPMTEVPCAAVLLAAVVSFRYAMKSDSAIATVGLAVIAGVLFGTGTLVRPVVLISCVMLTVHAGYCRAVQHMSTGVRRLTSRFAIVLIPAVVCGLTLAPWIIRNAIQFHRFIPATTHGGYTLALGNNPDFYRDVINGTDRFPWDGDKLDVWQLRMIAQCKADGVPVGDEPATDAWYYRNAVDAIVAEPASFLKATILRVRRFWGLTTADDHVSPILSAAVSVWYGALWIGLMLQLIDGLRQRNSPQSCGFTDLWLVVVSFLLIHSVYWTDARMRTPVMPILCVLSLSGWGFAWNSMTGWKNEAQRK